MAEQPRRRSSRALALSALALGAALSLSCSENILENLASGFFTFSAVPASVSVSPAPGQGACGTDRHVIVSVNQGVDVGDGTITIHVSSDVEDVGLTTCKYVSGGVLAHDYPTLATDNFGAVFDLGDGESGRLDLIFRPAADAMPGTYSVRVSAYEEGIDYDDAQNATVLVTILLPVAPTVSISTPADGSSIATSTVTLTGTADDDVGVESLAYRLNGGAEEGVTLGAPITAWTFDVSGLSLGANVIDVLARDGADLVGSASVNITYAPTTPQLTCNQVLQGTLGLGESALYDLALPAADFTYALRVESVDLDGRYDVLSDGVIASGASVGPGAVSDRLDNRLPNVLYAVTVSADNAGGTYRLSLVCERPLALGTNATVTQLGGLIRLYRFDGPSEPIHMGLHRAQVGNSIAVNVWHPSGSIGPNPIGNPAGGYASGEMVFAIVDVGAPHSVIWEALGFSPSDVDEYTFAVSTVEAPVALTLNGSNSATASGDVGHLGQLRYFTFQGVQGESYTLTLDHPTGALAAQVFVERLDASTPFYVSSYPTLATGATTRDPAEREATLGPFTLPADGIYAIRVGANASLTYDASLVETMGDFTVVLARQ